MAKPETEKQRTDRHFIELLQEYRVAQQGVQVLFAFLLTVPFMATFQATTAYQKWLWLSALVFSANSVVLFTGPVVHHRVLFKQRGVKDDIIRSAYWISFLALSSMLIAILSSTYLVTDVVFGTVAAMLFTISGLVVALIIWVLIPFRRIR